MTGKPSYGELEKRVQALEAAEARRSTLDSVLKKLFNLSTDMLCVADVDGYFRIVNSAFENTLGYTRQELLETPSIDFVHPDDKAATLAVREKLQATGEPLTCFENRYQCKDGSYKWLAWNSVIVPEDGLVYAVARDVTGQKAIQQELAAQRDLFEHVLSNVPASIFWKDRNSTYLGANQRFLRDAGIQGLQQLVGKTDYELAWTKEQGDFYRACDRKVMDSGEPMLNIEESQQQADGGKIDLLTNKVPLLDVSGQVTGMLGIYMDITRLKETEATLRKSELRLQTLFDSAAEFIFVIDTVGKIIRTNSYIYAQSGYVEDEVIGRNIRDFFTADSKKKFDGNYPGLRERGYNRADVEFVCKNGNVIHMECSATGVPDESGTFSTFLIIQRDVSERKRAADALANSEQRFRAIFNSTYQLIGVLDSEGTLLQANQTALDFGALAPEDVVGLPFWDTYWWSHSTEVRNRLKAAVKEAAQGKLVGYEEEVRGAGNVIRTIEFTLKPVVNQHGKTVLIIPEGRDITEKIRAEAVIQDHRQKLAHVIRLSTMGEMASGMAHELNQPLAALTSYCGTATSLAKSIPLVPQELCDTLERASAQAHRAGEIIRHLREFVSKEKGHKQVLDLDTVIEGIKVVLSSELKSANVKLEHHAGGRGRKVMANKVQIEQVIVNLVINSIEAIHSAQSEDGKIILETCVTMDEYLQVSVLDNGPGVDVEIFSRMFNPFQTSKESGMGMGLSISRSIVEAHGGRLWADERHSNGALMGFGLPVCVNHSLA